MYKSSFFSFVFRQPTCMELLRIYHTFGVQFSVFADKCVLRFFLNVIATNPWQRVFICAYCFVVSSMACIHACLLAYPVGATLAWVRASRPLYDTTIDGTSGEISSVYLR